ncbi:GNAT family N-acetyltransferase [Paenibacillus macerans]|uniref:Acetyltransferase domain protein n=1 Tax=Paenibacillus macerans TaxID=44252 RepID=A0A090ZAU8_PAEMA|nr:GNAT family N-acetyltransferase [Paenibacillus macerans]KFN08404.1 acetyltransferase domain protein [Paenibacillus macerans]MBS5914161.1 GNAT family N-acetyltransferase [Paenibacillus macerans]MCY7557165.1 GNAT family N-acetyltransferase [Paenibacillus macerans]MEC0138186.1 GNAT family N-acetyltransferase [Paenibacillus macerans]MEC0152441.1 GNAT family N-acetyltransferase [Paenibacillus macerans]
MRIEDYFENFPILETDRILLRPITYLDIEDMYEYCSVPEVSRYTTWEYHKSKDDTKGFIDFILNRYASEKVGPWGIEYKESAQAQLVWPFREYKNVIRNQIYILRGVIDGFTPNV